MNLAFDLPAVRRWAEFSGDFNPIHFDLAHARMAGMDRLIVHGMLVLMPIKQMLTRQNNVAGSTLPGWMKFKAAFRHPVAHDNDHVLATRSAGSQTTFKLSSSDACIEYFRGGYGPVETIPSDLAATPPTTHCFDLDRAQLTLFAQTYPDISAQWVALDAVVFAQFMRQGLPIVEQVVHDALRTQATDETTLNAIDTIVHKVVVQTSHAVYVDTGADYGQGDLHWALLPAVLIVHTGHVSGAVTLPVYCDNRPVMLVEIGLLAKVSQAPPLQ